MPDAPNRPTVSSIVLMASNAVPLFGVLLFGWAVFPIILLYWLENVVVGALNVAKILVAEPAQPIQWLAKVFLVPFFVVHYGMFTMVHGVFVFALFGGKEYAPSFFPTPALIQRAVNGTGILIAVIALVSSHVFSFIWNYLDGGEFRRISPALLMHQPYARVVVLHLAIIGGGFAVMALGAPVAALALLVVIKTGMDLKAHHVERAKLAAPPGGSDPMGPEERP